MSTDTPVPATPASRPLHGILWMLATGMCFVAVTAIVKHVGSEVPSPQAAFLRFAMGLVFLLPALPALMQLKLTRQLGALIAVRGVVHTAAVILWFYAMTRIPLAEVTAMNYLNPIWVAVGAALFLGEKMALRRILAILAALVGAMIILRPGVREIDPGHIAMLGTAFFFAGSYLVAKHLSGTIDPGVVVALMSICVTIGLAPFALAVWVTPTLVQLGWLFLVAFFATAGHYTMTLAFRAAPLTVTQPVTFLQLVWASLLGALVFAEPVDRWVVLGGAIIMASVMFITWRESVLRRQMVTPPVDATKQ